MQVGAWQGVEGPLSEAASKRVRAQLAANPPKRIIAICREHIGDLVNTTGALRTLRSMFPSARIVAEVGERAVGVLDGSGAVDEVLPRRTHQGLIGKARAIRRLRRSNFDLAVIFDDSNPHVVHARIGGIPIRVGIWRGKKHGGEYSCAAPYRTDRCETRDNFADLLTRIGAVSIEMRPELAVKAEHEERARHLLKDCGWVSAKPLIGLHPGASIPEKRWGTDKFVDLTNAILASGLQAVIIGGGQDTARSREIAMKTHSAFDLTGKTTILEVAALSRFLSVLVTNDTGVLHIAASQRTRCIAIYGPTDPIAFAPWGEGHQTLVGECGCRSRSEETCTGICRDSIASDHVFAVLREML